MPRLQWTSIFVTTLFLWACPREVTPSLDAGTLDFVGRACNVDAECGELRCDRIRRQCVCLSDESCRSSVASEALKFCSNYTGLCVSDIAGCKSDEDCVDAAGKVDPTLFCDASTRACRSRKGFCEPCRTDNECGGVNDDCVRDEALARSFCATSCILDADCPRGASCSEVSGKKRCLPKENPLVPTAAASCLAFKGCVPDLLRTCTSNADCGESGLQRCDKASGKCVASTQTCLLGTVCDPRNRICVAECSNDVDCGDPKLKCLNRVCEPISDCESDTQCPVNKVCSVPPGQKVGQCQPFCQGNESCPLGQVCKLGTDQRYRCESGCVANFHQSCPVDARCNPTTLTCEGPVVGTTRICQSSVVCKSCELCNLASKECVSAKDSFPYCASCASDAECTGGACVQLDDGLRYCARYCGNGQECPQNFVCLPIGSGSTSACVPSDRRCQGKCP